MVLAGYTEIEEWVQLMRAEPAYALLSGFAPGDVPGVGTFYDFSRRLLGGAPGRRRVKRPPATRKTRRALRDEKRAPGKKHVALITRLARTLLAGSPAGQHWRAPCAERLVNTLLDRLCVRPTVARGLLPPEVGVSGDGTRVATFANRHGQKLCACAHRCSCPRRFTDAEASVGYDAHHDRFVFGHNLYYLTAWNPDRTGPPVELPVYLLRATGKRSDALLGPLALWRAREVTSVQIRYACFDGAHDAAGFYRLGAAWQVPLFIPLASLLPQGGPLPRDRDGTPLCLAGRRMYPDGYHRERERFRWRCPLVVGPERGDVTTCPHREACSTAKHGRMVYTYPGQDERLNAVPPRGTAGWQAVYDRRTASERTNARQCYHLRLGRTRTRGGARWLFRMLLTAIAQYLLTWDKYLPQA
jgi:hypothetical protein